MSNATVVRVRPLGYNDDGDPVTGQPSRLTIDECAVAPRSSSGPSSADITDRGRQGVVVGLSLYAPYGTDIVHTDQIEVDGVLYDVDGEGGQWKHPGTHWEAGCEIALKRATG